MSHAASSLTKRVAVSTSLIVGIVALAIYVRTLRPGLGFWDTGEFQTVAYVLGIAHPTGYPLYILLGKAWTFWPFGSVAYRMNLMSALCAALAASGLTAVSLRLGVRPLLALSAGLCFAFSPNLWATANHADPHTLHAALTAGLWLLALRWADGGDRRAWSTLALGLGLGLGNHMLMLLEAPALLLIALGARPGVLRSIRNLGLALGCGLLGLSVYGYLPLRARMHPLLDYGHPATWRGFCYVVLAEQFQSQMGFLTWGGLQSAAQRLPEVMGWYADWYTVLGREALFALALIGFWNVFARRALVSMALVLGIALPFYMACTYQNAELGRYFVVPSMLMLVLASVGGERLLGLLRGRLPGGGRVIGAVIVLLAVLAPVGLVGLHWAEVDQHDHDEAERYARSLYAVLKPHAVILAWWSLRTPLWYASYVEGLRPDVRIVDDSEGFTRDEAGLKATLDRYYGKAPIYLVLDDTQSAEAARYFRLRRLSPMTAFRQEVDEVVSRASEGRSPTSPRR